jgi:hypothetical protein
MFIQNTIVSFELSEQGLNEAWWDIIPMSFIQKHEVKYNEIYFFKIHTLLLSPYELISTKNRKDLFLKLTRGFKVFYNRGYFLNFRRYLKNLAGGLRPAWGPQWVQGVAPQKLLKSSILWTKKCTSKNAKHK